LVEDGEAVAGGVCNPATGQLFLGSLTTGVTLNGSPVRTTSCTTLHTADILASRTEVQRGEWAELSTELAVRPAGSVAYKLALVAAGLADATWSLVPKHEWDVAAGVALVKAAGGAARTLRWEEPRFNRRVPKLSGLIAAGAGLEAAVRGFLADRNLLGTRGDP
jgi:myo-inositol-1(or 4)-monophosphatase